MTLDAEVRALFKRYEGRKGEDRLHALLAACGLRFEVAPDYPIPFEQPGYVHPVTSLRASLADAQRVELRAQAVELDAHLFAQRPPWPEPTPAERWAALVQDQRERDEQKSAATRAAERLRRRRDIVRYGCRRLRAGNGYRWARPLAQVRAETAAALRELGHAGLARWVDGAELSIPRGPVVQMELGL
jgi:hypothetical protein